MYVLLSILVPVGLVLVYIGVSFFTGGKSVKMEHRYKEWRVTGKGMLDNMDKHQNDIDKYMR